MASILATRATHVEGPQTRYAQFKDLTLIKKVAVVFATAIEALLYTVTLGCLFSNPKVYFNRLVTWMTPEVPAEALRDPNSLAIVPYTEQQIPAVDLLHVKAEEIFARRHGPLEMRLFAQEQKAQELAIVPYRQWEKRAAPEVKGQQPIQSVQMSSPQRKLRNLFEKLQAAPEALSDPSVQTSLPQEKFMEFFAALENAQSSFEKGEIFRDLSHFCYLELNKPKIALTNLDNAINEFRKSSGQEEYVASCYFDKGSVHQGQGEHELALRHYILSLSLWNIKGVENSIVHLMGCVPTRKCKSLIRQVGGNPAQQSVLETLLKQAKKGNSTP